MSRTHSAQILRDTHTTPLSVISAALTVAGFVALATAATFILGPASAEPAQPWPTVVGVAGGLSALAGLFLARWGTKG